MWEEAKKKLASFHRPLNDANLNTYTRRRHNNPGWHKKTWTRMQKKILKSKLKDNIIYQLTEPFKKCSNILQKSYAKAKKKMDV